MEYCKLIEKYSVYNRKELEACGKSLSQQNRLWVQHLLKVVEIQHTGYKMNMAEEKRIGKARNKKHIVTYKEAFSHLENIVPTDKNIFLFRNRI